ARRFLLLYGTEIGTAKAIAQDLCAQAERFGLDADLHCLSKTHDESGSLTWIPSETKEKHRLNSCLKSVIVVYRELTVSCFFSAGLGDTNYTNFCNCGRTMDRRLAELGAQRFYQTGHADDAVGTELVAEPWVEGLWEALVSECKQEGGGTSRVGERVADVSPPRERDQEHGDAGKQISESTEKTLDQTQPEKPLVPSLTVSVPPLSEATLQVPSLPEPYLQLQFDPSRPGVFVERMGHHFIPAASEVCEVAVSGWKQLTRADAVKTALELQLDVSDAPFALCPGDALGVLCPNGEAEVDALLRRLGLDGQADCTLELRAKPNARGRASKVPDFIPAGSSLRSILTHGLEIRALPKKAMVRALAEHTEDEAERRRLLELSSRQGSADYTHLLRDASLGLAALLHAFPSCRPPASLLIEHLPRLQPRAYSIASSPLVTPGAAHVVFNVVEFAAGPGRPQAQRGVCTGWLAEVVVGPEAKGNSRPSNLSGAPLADPKLLSPKAAKSTGFRLPEDASVPIIMIGPGTGVAPFVGFLQHREHKAGGGTAALGESWLFFGCRHRDRDFLYREQLEGFVARGTLTHLRVAFSRDEPAGSEVASPGGVAHPRYVQHSLGQHRADVMRLLLQEGARLYVCGDAKNMARDVQETLVDMVVEEMGVAKLEAMRVIGGLKEQGRYLQDVWT
uniref:Methionine synthase reductase n=1 Tax=Petromyzon marinus TaxID=7757 RepID=S4RH50_PETMA